jgi:hypothetical protein
MKKVLALVVSVLSATLVSAADFASIALDAGYNNYYVVNGVSFANETPHASLGAVKSFKHADVYVGSTMLTDDGKDQTHWLVGAGKNLYTYEDITARLDVTALRHQTESIGIENSTELGVKLAVSNPWVTPYVRGIFNLELDQNGYAFGGERVQKLPFGFVVTPSVEWGKLTDYSYINVKGMLTRPFDLSFGTITPYASVGWFDNDFDVTTYNFSTTQFNNDVVYTAGIKLTF